MKRNFLLLSLLLFFNVTVIAQPGALDVTFNTNDIGFGSGIGVDGRSDDIRSILIGSEGDVFLGGSFERYNEIYTPGFIQVRNDGFRTFFYNLPTTLGNGVSEVNTMVEVDGAVLIGGRLNYWATNLSTQRRYYGIARVSKFGGFESIPFNSGIVDDCTINEMVKESNGSSVIVAGSFTYFNGQKFVSGLGRFNGNWDPFFNPETGNGTGMSAVALQSDGQILVAGGFNFANGLPQYGIARLNTNGSIDNSFTPGSIGNGVVTKILVQPDGKIIITGGFTSYNGTPRNGIVRINSDGSIDNSFGNPSIGTNAYVAGAARQTDGKVVIGGYFPSLPGISNFKNSVIRINSNGTIDNSFTSGNTNESEDIKTITIQSDGKILVGGRFTFYNNKPLNDVIRLNSNGTHDPTFNPSTGVVGPRPINIFITTMNVQSDNKIIIGGKFNSYNGNSHNNLQRINPDGSSDGTFTSGIPVNNLFSDYIGTSALQTDGKVIVSGSFVLPGRSAPSSLARLNSNGSIDNTFNPGSIASNNINQIHLLQNGKILVSGDSTSNIGERLFYLVRLNTNGSIDNTFNAGTGANGAINEIATQSDGKIVIAGYFTTFNGTARNYITRLNADGSLDNSFNPGTGANSGIDKLLVQSDGKILIGGIFTSYNGTTRNYLARLNADGSLDNNFNIGTGPGAPIIEMALQLDNKLLISGNFTTYNGTASNRLARINTDGSIDNIFQSGTGPSWGIYNIVVQPDERILIGGIFSSYNNIGRNRIARLLKCQPDVITLTSAANTNNQSVCSGVPITNITYTITGATGASITGLPAGITGTYSNGTYTISGTGTAAGTYNYSLRSTGGCSITITGTITIRPANTVGTASSSPTPCINTLMTSITHSTSVATGIGTATGLPAGITAAWNNNVITISGTPTASGTFNYAIPLTGGCGTVAATGTITVRSVSAVGQASSSPTLCASTLMTPITHTTTGASGIGAPAGLPAGVSAIWSNNTITISGTPTASGTFNYSIPLTGCGNISATGTITVNPLNTAGAASTTPSLCVNTPLTNITHTTTRATGIGTATGLPAGVTAAWNNNVITISGAPTAAGTFNYSIPLTGGCGTVAATGTITVRANNTVTAATSSPAVCVNFSITPITHNTTGATGIGTAVNLPAGVTAGWAAGKITISGTPTVTGTFNYSIPLTGGCGTAIATGTIIVNPSTPNCFPTSASNLEMEESIRIYPNPLTAGKSIQVNFINKPAGKYILSVTNLLGMKIMAINISHSGGGMVIYPVQVNDNLSIGTYILEITNQKDDRTILKLKIDR